MQRKRMKLDMDSGKGLLNYNKINGNGTKIDHWSDRWWKKLQLQQKFPELFDTNKDRDIHRWLVRVTIDGERFLQVSYNPKPHKN